MLAQLVCLDRRYQRMNCFNMRELQALLKEKYFADIINNYDHRTSIFNSLNIRYKLNDLSTLDNETLLFINNSLRVTDFAKLQQYANHASTLQSIVKLNYSIIVHLGTSLSDFSTFVIQLFRNIVINCKTSTLTELISLTLNTLFGSVLDFGEILILNLNYLIKNSFILL